MVKQKITPLINRDIANVFLRDIHKRKSEGRLSLEKYATELAEQMVKGEPNIAYLLNEIIKLIPKSQEEGFLSGFGLCYDLFRRKTEREYLET